jgi:uncharacterized protein with HEPN domain
LSRDKDALLDILEMLDLIQQHGPKDEQALRNDVVQQAATLRWLEIIGEAAGRISPELKADHPEIPWRGAIAMRNLVVHGYDRVKLDIVWRVIKDELPPLKSQISAIVDELH